MVDAATVEVGDITLLFPCVRPIGQIDRTDEIPHRLKLVRDAAVTSADLKDRASARKATRSKA